MEGPCQDCYKYALGRIILFSMLLYFLCLWLDHSKPPNKLATQLQLGNVYDGVCVWGKTGKDSKGGGCEIDKRVLVNF